MGYSLTWRDATTLPVEADGLAATAFTSEDAAALARRVLPVGNDTVALGDLFSVEVMPGAAPDVLQVHGNLRHVRSLGKGLSSGRIEVHGDAGPFLGLKMTGGAIQVRGSAGHWAGAEMAGGMLRIEGDAGDHLGSARPGSRMGMREGVILVDGATGNEAGLRMRRGLIAVKGSVGLGFGRQMIAGTLLTFGAAGRLAGMGMKRGTLGPFGSERPCLSESFAASGRYRFPFLTIYIRQLRQWGFSVPSSIESASFERYNGDRAVGGQGEVLVFAGSAGG